MTSIKPSFKKSEFDQSKFVNGYNQLNKACESVRTVRSLQSLLALIKCLCDSEITLNNELFYMDVLNVKTCQPD